MLDLTQLRHVFKGDAPAQAKPTSTPAATQTPPLMATSNSPT